MMEKILDEVKRLATPSDQARRTTITALRDLANSLETPNDTIHRFGHMNLQAATVKVGMDLGIFKVLAKSSSPQTVQSISKTTNADPVLINRILRLLASIGAVHEAGKDQFTANHVTRNLAEPLVEAGISHYFGTASPMYQVMPEFLKKGGYKDPVDGLHTCFQDAFHTELPVFAWFGSHPEHLAPFNDYMKLRRKPDLSWLAVYPVAEEIKGWDASKPLFVNIGGGVGHQCAEFKEKYPDAPGKVILQDLPHSIAEALPTPGVDNMAHNIFEPQPVKGAKFYHLRAILHDHPPDKVQEILKHTKAAMTQDSIMLLDEMIFPESNVHYDAASIDMTMMTVCASMERTEEQWRKTLAEAGLELVKTYTYNAVSYENVMDVRLPKPQ